MLEGSNYQWLLETFQNLPETSREILEMLLNTTLNYSLILHAPKVSFKHINPRSVPIWAAAKPKNSNTRQFQSNFLKMLIFSFLAISNSSTSNALK